MDVDPLTKVGIMLAIRRLAAENAGITDRDGLAALEWALNRGILQSRPGVPVFNAGRQDDLQLTEHGRQVVAGYWRRQEARRNAA